MDLKKITGVTKKKTVEFEGQKLHLEYYVRAVKLKDIVDRPDPNDQPAIAHFTATVLSRRLVSWDLMDGTKKVGTSYEDLIELPWDFINAVLEGMNTDEAPGEATGSN